MQPNTRHGHLHLPRASDHGLENVAAHGTRVVREVTRVLYDRSSSSSSAANNDGCSPDDKSARCAKPTDSTNTQTLPIVLGAVIPICCALVVFYFLHRRNKKRQALEDRTDPHKSLDFGLETGGSMPPSKKRGGAKRGADEMRITHPGDDAGRSGHHPGLSMDMLGSPYLLPGKLNGSRESLHSMSRSMHDEHDPYRPVGMMRSSTDTSRSPRPLNDHASVYSASTMHTTGATNDKSNLLRNSQNMSQSNPRMADSLSKTRSNETEETTLRQTASADRSAPPSRKESLGQASLGASGPLSQISEKHSLPPLPSPEINFELTTGLLDHESTDRKSPPATLQLPTRKSSAGVKLDARHLSDASVYDDEIPPPPPPPKVMLPDDSEYDDDPNMVYNGRFSIDNSAPSQQPMPPQNNRASMMGLRPLPPVNPEENAEQRANRIRSFYKEYFDDSRPPPANAHYEEIVPDYFDGVVYDPDSGGFLYAPNAPYAQPVGRRAMTPPPAGARFAGDHNRHFSTMSGGRGPRGRAPPPQKKQLPPPKDLTSLPTPHLLKNDSALFTAADFAPPTSFREVQNGRRPDSPMGIKRSYSPAVRAYSPLVGAFDEMAALPSPHLLRKSGTFTSLDFAPPRFKGQDSPGSETGSIRSARSGISAMQMDAVRSGAYRVSRIPKEFVTTKDDLRNHLRPKMDLISPS